MQLDGGGGLPARPEKEAWGLLIEVNLIYLPFLYLQLLFWECYPPYFLFYIFPFFYIQGLRIY